MFPSTSSRETSGLSGKQNQLFPSGTYIKCIMFLYLDEHCDFPTFNLKLKKNRNVARV